MKVYVAPYIAATNDRSARLKILNQILEETKVEAAMDASQWTLSAVEIKLKKMAAQHRRAARAQAAAVTNSLATEAEATEAETPTESMGIAE